LAKSTDIRVKAAQLYFLPVTTRVPLKFGPETLTSVTCARVKLTVESVSDGRIAQGWGETPLSVQWVWPSQSAYEPRHRALRDFSKQLIAAWIDFDTTGHPLEIGHAFTEQILDETLSTFNQSRTDTDANDEPMPHLAALVANASFDIALHDAYGNLHGLPIYQTYNSEFMNDDLARLIAPAENTDVHFEGRFPNDYLHSGIPEKLPAWHLVGGLDPLDENDLTGDEPDDGYPVTLPQWIQRDGLRCLKIKLCGNDSDWDYDRLVRVGQIAIELMNGGATSGGWLTTDFNCTVDDPAYVNEILDRLMIEHPRIYAMILYVEQPFPYDLEANRIDVHSVSARKPLFMDESAHDWRLVRLGRSLGWTGVALKTCKTQTGAILAACWAKAHGMTLMVQDLTNPMLAQIPHVLLAAHTGTIMGVETNAMQFYPEASNAEAKVHPGLYQRRAGCVDLSSISGPGFGYRLDEIDRALPEAQ
jgi:L-alanine-DL-glutamate epimerase-like enolase superfamily enzyme